MRGIAPALVLALLVLAAACTEQAPLVGSLEVTSTPRRAEVYLDGTFQGRTPLVIGNLTPGSHLLQIRHVGYAEQVEIVTITPGNRTTISAVYPTLPTPTPTASLTVETTPGPAFPVPSLSTQPPALGAIYITSFPEGATVYLNGKGYGITPRLIGNLTPGTYGIRLSLVGWKDYQVAVSVSPGQTTIEEAILKS